jgi:3-phenylpropionate/trans-cinnamate dioxygenase ferredoxin reductase component
VLVDAHLTSSHPDVFAARDIAEHHHPVLSARVRVEHWANALNQGVTAGANAAGAGQVYDGTPYFFSDQYDMGMEYSGWATGYGRVVFRGRPGGWGVRGVLSVGRAGRRRCQFAAQCR